MTDEEISKLVDLVKPKVTRLIESNAEYEKIKDIIQQCYDILWEKQKPIIKSIIIKSLNNGFSEGQKDERSQIISRRDYESEKYFNYN